MTQDRGVGERMDPHSPVTIDPHLNAGVRRDKMAKGIEPGRLRGQKVLENLRLIQ